MTGLGKGIGNDPEKMRGALAERWGFIYEFDIGKHREDALAALRADLEASGLAQ